MQLYQIYISANVCGLNRLLCFACLCWCVHIKENTGITMYFTAPNKSKSIQTRRKEECLQEDAQRRGPQTSYCSEERIEKEE